MPTHIHGRARIKTRTALGGRGGVHANERYVHQFQIALLELEKARRSRERQAALARIQRLDERLLGIEILIRARRAALDGAAPAGREPSP